MKLSDRVEERYNTLIDVLEWLNSEELDGEEVVNKLETCIYELGNVLEFSKEKIEEDLPYSLEEEKPEEKAEAELGEVTPEKTEADLNPEYAEKLHLQAQESISKREASNSKKPVFKGKVKARAKKLQKIIDYCNKHSVSISKASKTLFKTKIERKDYYIIKKLREAKG